MLIGARSSVDPLLRYTKKAVKKDEIDFDFLTVPLATETLGDGARHVLTEDAMLSPLF